MGISLDNPVFEGDSLRALLLWIVKRFDQCLVIVGDHLCRYNERIFNGLKDDDAIKVAQEAGDSFILRTRELFQQFPPGKIRLTRWKQHLDTDEYKKSKTLLDHLFISNPDFGESVQKDARSFVTRQAKRDRLAIQPSKAVELSCQYLLEEVAVFSALAEQGWQVELYPGPELRVLVEVAKGKYYTIPEGLKKRISVELEVSA
jgi:tRNA-dependent cyclodipeptide synthase